MKRLIIISVTFFIIRATLLSQTAINADSLYNSARNHAFASHYLRARTEIQILLVASPGHADALNLLARIYAWEHKYDSSHAVTAILLKADSTNKEALLTRGDVFIWSGQTDSALITIDKGLFFYPRDSSFLAQLEKLQSVASGFQPFSRYRSYDAVSLYHSFDFHNEPWVRRWHVTTAEYSRKRDNYFLSAALNTGDLVLQNEQLYSNNVNSQIEANYYQKLKKGYFYTGYAWSGGTLFARNKAAAEYFLPVSAVKAEFSFGIRYFNYPVSPVPNLFAGTISAGKDLGRSFLMVRYFFVPVNGNLYHSFFVKHTVYAANRLTYFFTLLGYGAAPDSRQRADQFEITTQNGPYARIGGQARVYARLYIFGEGGLKIEEYLPGYSRTRVDVMAGIRYVMN